MSCGEIKLHEVEKLEANPITDRLIARLIMRFGEDKYLMARGEIVGAWFAPYGGEYGILQSDWKPTKNDEQAIRVLNRVVDLYKIDVKILISSDSYSIHCEAPEDFKFSVSANTYSLAVCKFALAALCVECEEY